MVQNLCPGWVHLIAWSQHCYCVWLQLVLTCFHLLKTVQHMSIRITMKIDCITDVVVVYRPVLLATRTPSRQPVSGIITAAGSHSGGKKWRTFDFFSLVSANGGTSYSARSVSKSATEPPTQQPAALHPQPGLTQVLIKAVCHALRAFNIESSWEVPPELLCA